MHNDDQIQVPFVYGPAFLCWGISVSIIPSAQPTVIDYVKMLRQWHYRDCVGPGRPNMQSKVLVDLGY